MAESNFSGPGPVPMAKMVWTPAARARSSMASRSSANCGKSMCAWESMSRMGYLLSVLGRRTDSRNATRCSPMPARLDSKEQHVQNDREVRKQNGPLDGQRMAHQRIHLPRQIHGPGQQREPLSPFAIVPKTVGLGETHDGVDHGGPGQSPQTLVVGVTRRLDEQIRQVASRTGMQEPYDLVR